MSQKDLKPFMNICGVHTVKELLAIPLEDLQKHWKEYVKHQRETKYRTYQIMSNLSFFYSKGIDIANPLER